MQIKDSKIWGVLRKSKAKWKHYQARLSPKGMDLLRLIYAQCYMECKTENNMILYEAYAGRGMVCSPYGIFNMFYKRKDFIDYTHIWVVEKEEQRVSYKSEWKASNIIFVVRDTKEYCEYLCKAKYLINNLSFPNYFTKKEEQVYMNTWHGIPLKTLGFDISEGRITGLNTIRNFLSVDVFTSPNSFMTERFQKAFLLDGLAEGNILEIGMPRNDNLFHTDRETITQKLLQAGVKIEKNKKIILYAPTWKGEKYSSPDTSTELYFQLMKKIEEKVDTDNYQILVKPHQIVYKYIMEKGEKLTDQFVPASIDTNELLSVVDVLISDYSSIYFDYLASGKPILFYIPDLESYQEQRGLYFGIDKLPGPIAQNLEELGELSCDFTKAMEPYREKYEKEKNWACGMDDGNVCNRVIETVIKGNKMGELVPCNTQSKTKILAYSGELQSSTERKALESWISKMDFERFDLTLLVPHTATDTILEWIRNVDKRVRVLRRTGKIAVTKKDYKYADMLTKKNMNQSNYDEKTLSKLKQLCQIELIRTIGMAKFDYVIDFSEKSYFYQNLFQCMKEAEYRKAEELENFF